MSVWRAVQSLALFPEENSKSKPNEASDICRGQTAPLDWWASFLDLCSSRTEAALNTGIGYESHEQSLWPVFNRDVDLQDRQSWLYLLNQEEVWLQAAGGTKVSLRTAGKFTYFLLTEQCGGWPPTLLAAGSRPDCLPAGDGDISTLGTAV